MTAVIPIGPETRDSELSADAPAVAGHQPSRALSEALTSLRPRTRRRWLLPLGDALVGLAAASSLDPLAAMAGARLRPADLLLAVLWVCLLAAMRAYEHRPVFGLDDVRRVARAGVGLAFVGLLLEGVGRSQVDGGQLLLLVALVTTASTVERRLALAPPGRHKRSTTRARVVVAGHQHAVGRMLAELRAAGSPFTVVGVCVAGHHRAGQFDVPVTTGFQNLRSCVAQHGADAVIVIPCRHVDPPRLRRLGWDLETAGTHLFVATCLGDVGPTRASLGHAGSLPLIHVRHAELRGGRRLAKELWERLAAALALVIFAPLLLLLALLVRMESEGPALFRQTRVGKNGKPFMMLKLRTMCVDAEQRRSALAESEPGEGVLFKLRADPRITRVGRFLRTYSLDELPQLINVVRGEMALVGPRPPLPDEVDQYDDDTHRRLAVTPGLTGLWQVSGRSDLSWEDSVRLDLRYVENWSIGLDLRILCRTFRAVIGHHGAY